MNTQFKLHHICYLCKYNIKGGHSLGSCQFYLTTYFNKKPQWVCCCNKCLINPQMILENVNNFINGSLEINDIPIAIRTVLNKNPKTEEPNLKQNLLVKMIFDTESEILNFLRISTKNDLVEDKVCEITTMNVIYGKHMNFTDIQNIEEYKTPNKFTLLLEIKEIDNKTKILTQINDKQITLLNPGTYKFVFKSIIN